MELIPAIDVRDGRCVRLYQGDYARETVYSEDPSEVALHWVSVGATRLHVVDLDGAREGAPVNLDVVRKIVSAVSVPVQLGGGIRSAETAREVLALGLDRVIFGTAAIEAPDIVASVCRDHGPSTVIVGVDARDGYVAVKGWTERKEVLASELVHRMAAAGVERFMYTDIARDGTLTGPNFEAVQALLDRTEAAVLAAGGISSVAHLIRLDGLGVEGAIVGTAVYTGDIDMTEALRVLEARDTEQEK